MAEFKIASLFSGAGGLDWGFKETGYRIVFANEILRPAVLTYSRNFGLKLVECGRELCEAQEGVAMLGDIARVSFTELAEVGVDVVLGGPPCQDFSVVRGPAWDRRGIEVVRGRLYAHFVRALAVMQPKVFVFENVPGIISANKGSAYRVILEDFRNLNLRWDEVRAQSGISNGGRPLQGYEIVFSDVVDFSYLGVPQRRERLIVVGVRRDLIKDIATVGSLRRAFEKVLSGESWLFRRYPLTPLEVFEGRPLPDLQDKYVEVMKEWEDVWSEVKTEGALRWKAYVWDRLTFDIVRDYISANGIVQNSRDELEEAWHQHYGVLKELKYLGKSVCSEPLPDGTCNSPEESRIVIERMRRIPPGENHEFVRGTKWEVEGKGISLVYRRIHPLKPSYTIVAYGGGGTHGYHYERGRATLTLREKARLQTFPDSFFFSGSKTEIRAQIGEAVPPLAAKRLAQAVADVLSQTG